MKIDASLRVEDIGNKNLCGVSVVVFDVLRATSTIATALANGCQGVIAVEEIDYAKELFKKLKESGKPAILGGERAGSKIEGFNFGNSPLEYDTSVVPGKILVLTTSNGTRAISACEQANNVYLGSLLNAEAVARVLHKKECDVLLACAGSAGEFCLEDAVAAGIVANHLIKLSGKYYPRTTDVVIALCALANHYYPNAGQSIYHSAHGKKLMKLGYTNDLAWCSQVDIYDFVPEVKDGIILLTSQSKNPITL